MRTVVKRQGAVLLSLAGAGVGRVRRACAEAARGAARARGGPQCRAVPGPAATCGEQPAPPAPAAGTRYRIDPARSELRVLVYRAGPMASLGHNHVVSTHSLQGWAVFNGDPAAAAFALTARRGGFRGRRSDAASREEGADFAEEVDRGGKVGTRHNMLGSAVLDAGGFAVDSDDKHCRRSGRGRRLVSGRA